ncbi:STAS domain-containing protein [Sutcliffiella rhizosphaerae]|uniref:RsbT co-antagonist protein RsbRC n=1 Tax=Sutcliffiella rhizosphaerae TaxID=2880967 RepID=A0ABM8YL36_9BACI|nr:STAS domain-containing protein [Sutcliffiella rhizosphaerae]CAG9620655.1 RsbT co-antagonist protein RsbRC [Sutcliffiella rhizosphaerae]
MHRNKDLHNFLLDKAKVLTDEWYESLDKSATVGVYASTDPLVIKTLKKQNFDFHLHLCKIFIEEEDNFFHNFEEWIQTVAQDEEHLNTPIHITLHEFFRVRGQYLEFIAEFVQEHQEEKERELRWNHVIIKAFDNVVLKFVEENQKYSNERLQAQQEMIQELSSPVIALDNNRALLPLVGDIDTTRAKFILEHTLEQCGEKGINHLYIDLSGVVIIDTLVADQIFNLLKALNLIGVKTTLSGIRPEIAQTTVQLGISFNEVSIRPTLAGALTLPEANILR